MADSAVPSEPPPSYDTAAAESEHLLPTRQPQSAASATAAGAGPSSSQKGALLPPPPPIQLPILSYLRSKRVILASASPRRRALLAQLGLPKLEIRPSSAPENLSKSEYGPYEYVSATARQKCLTVYTELLDEQRRLVEARDNHSSDTSVSAAVPPDPDVVIAADTVIVTRDGRVLEKPRSAADHTRMLRLLRDTGVHRVLTAVCVLAPKADASHPGYAMAAHTEETRVHFADAAAGLPDDVIDAYVRTREGADKAGGYALQGVGGMLLVDRIEGGVDNVVGLPVRKTLQLCEKVVFRQDEEEEADDDDDIGGYART